MSNISYILLAIVFMSTPFVFFRLYLNSIEKNAKRMLESNMTDSSELFKDLKVWIKNFDIFKKKNKFDFDPSQTNYSFNDCDLIINNENFIVIGKSKFFGKRRYATPTIFEFGDNNTNKEYRVVKCKKIREVGADLEIEFIDSSYSNSMTLVIKRIDNVLKEKLLQSNKINGKEKNK